MNTSQVQGVDPDLRIRPFFAQGGTISMREFIVGALHGEMGLEAVDPDLAAASAGGRVVTPSGMVLDGSQDAIEAPPPPDPKKGNEIDVALVDHLEFYLLNYFNPGTYRQDESAKRGLQVFNQLGCTTCHVQNLTVNHDRRVADVNTVYDPVNGIFNHMFATATALIHTVNDGSGHPPLMVPNGQLFVVHNIFTDFKRHDLGPNFHERNWDGTIQTQFLTRALSGVGSVGSLGHDGRSLNLLEVILRHGGEAQASRDAFANLTLQLAGWPSIREQALSRRSCPVRCASTGCFARVSLRTKTLRDHASKQLPADEYWFHQPSIRPLAAAMILLCEHPAPGGMRERPINSTVNEMID